MHFCHLHSEILPRLGGWVLPCDVDSSFVRDSDNGAHVKGLSFPGIGL